ncbi:hypothetical protein RSJ42_13575 [Methanosarcina hadiensis]|uniref:hypothetical protein n=1 Tax=Methanosarcina hadiensis TaxID=3078083 RepID=UPI0039772FD3
MNQHYFSLDDYYKSLISLDGINDYYKYFVGLDGIILSFLVMMSYPAVVNLATKASFLIILVGAICILIDNWNRKSIAYRLYVELYENEYEAKSDYKAGKVFVNLIFYVISIYLISGVFVAP